MHFLGWSHFAYGFFFIIIIFGIALLYVNVCDSVLIMEIDFFSAADSKQHVVGVYQS